MPWGAPSPPRLQRGRAVGDVSGRPVGEGGGRGTGIRPGWACEDVPVGRSGVSKRVERVAVREILDYATYPSRVTIFDLMAFGLPPERPSMIQLGIAAGKVFDAPLQMVA